MMIEPPEKTDGREEKSGRQKNIRKHQKIPKTGEADDQKKKKK